MSVVCSFRLSVSKVDFVRRYTTQFSLWCIAKAVLLLGCDLSAPLIANGTAADFYEIVSPRARYCWHLGCILLKTPASSDIVLTALLTVADVLEFYSSDTRWVVAR